MDEEQFAALRGSPFVGADAAVGGCDVAGIREGIGRVGTLGIIVVVSGGALALLLVGLAGRSRVDSCLLVFLLV